MFTTTHDWRVSYRETAGSVTLSAWRPGDKGERVYGLGHGRAFASVEAAREFARLRGYVASR